MSFAQLTETYGEQVNRIIRRYGLYCAVCAHSPLETIRQGAKKHGLDDHQLARLIAELIFVIGKKSVTQKIN